MFHRRSVLLGSIGLAGAGLLRAPRAFAADGPSLPADLISAAKGEGQINVITLPRDWANWGVTMDRFQELYGVKLDDANPDGSSAEELQAIRSLKSQSRAPDVVDVGPAFAVSGTKEKLFQPYKVATWNEIPDDVKHPDGYYYGDYFGVQSFAVNKSVVKNAPQTWADLKKPEYKGMVSLNGNPLGAGAAFGAVFAASLANGGSYDNLEPGIEFFGEMAKIGNYNPVAATTGTLSSGQTPIVINWDYLSLAIQKKEEGKTEIEVLVPKDAKPYGAYYCQAISVYAPHAATAKLWMEYVYSDEGQLAFLGGFAHPIRFNSLVAAGKIPEAMLKGLPPAEAYKDIKFASLDQQDAAHKKLNDLWPRVVKF